MKRIINAVIVATCLLISSCGNQNIKIDNNQAIAQYSIPFIIENDPIVMYRPMIVNSIDVNCLAKGIYYEASGEPIKGKEAVGLAIMHRTTDKKYPSRVCDVIKQRVKIKDKIVCQFSWYCQGGDNKLHQAIYNPSYEACMTVAQAILSGELDNWLPRVISFHVSGINPHWTDHGMVKVAQIGNHIFYRRKVI